MPQVGNRAPEMNGNLLTVQIRTRRLRGYSKIPRWGTITRNFLHETIIIHVRRLTPHHLEYAHTPKKYLGT